MISLKDRKTLITGGSRGIGRAAALLFAEAGSDVAINYQCRDEAALERQEPRSRSAGRRCLRSKADISNETEVSGHGREIVGPGAGSMFSSITPASGPISRWGRGHRVLEGDDGGQPGQRLLSGRRRRPAYEETGRGLDRQCRLDRRNQGRGSPLPLCRHEGGHERPDQVLGRRNSRPGTSTSTASPPAGWTRTCAPRSSATRPTGKASASPSP